MDLKTSLEQDLEDLEKQILNNIKDTLGDLYDEHKDDIITVTGRIKRSYLEVKNDPDGNRAMVTYYANMGHLQSLEAKLMKNLEEKSVDFVKNTITTFGEFVGMFAKQAIVSFVAANKNRKIT